MTLYAKAAKDQGGDSFNILCTPCPYSSLQVPALLSAPRVRRIQPGLESVHPHILPLNEMSNDRRRDSLPGMVRLSVGGVYYETTAETLSNAGTSYFSARAEFCRSSGEEGPLVLDRDGEMFRHVLNFLRGNALHMDDEVSLRQLLDEADYFCIASLKDACAKKIAAILKKRAEEREDIRRCIVEAIEGAVSSNLNISTDHLAVRAGPVKVRRIGEGPLDRGLVFSMTEDF